MRSFTRTAPRALPALALAVMATLVAAPPAFAQRERPASWPQVPTTAIDTMSSRTLYALHRRLAAHEDSLIGYGTALLARDARLRLALHPRRGPLTAAGYAFLVGGVVAYNATCPLGRGCERDRGGYVDRYGSIDKVAHGASAMALTSLAIGGGVQPEAAAAITVLGGVAFELTQARGDGYYSGRDVVANTAGAMVAWGWHRWARWARDR